jgi:bifunctional non-homologous end joining protein LigD
VKPELVAQIEFSTWTRDNLVRQAAFKGLREDKPAREVVREEAIKSEEAIRPEETKPAAVARKASHKTEARARRGKEKSPVDAPAVSHQSTHDQPSTHESTQSLTHSLTHPDKILDPESGMTKLQLAEYYIAVADRLIPHIANRPLSVVRCPEGSSKPCFFQKHIGLGLPPGIGSIAVPNPKTGGKEDYITVDSAEGLVGLAQMGVMEIHPWGSQNDSLEEPDRIVFDLDPDIAIDWKTLRDTARLLRSKLEELGLESWLKTTGGKGLHVVVPIKPERPWKTIKEFAHGIALAVEREHPDLYVTKMTKATRKNRIYLDYLRNDRGSTAVAAYSPRARAGVPVAMPLEWKELDARALPKYHVTELDKWKSRLARDPWKDLGASPQKLTERALRGAEAAQGSRRR